jgi:rSAM/selenodomain-associated transferase 1
MTFANHLVVFARSPVVGRVKRRLGRTEGAVEAARIYRVLVYGLLRRVARDPRWRCWLYLDPDSAATDSGGWPQGLARRGQGTGDLGARMARPFRDLPPGPVVLVGTDIPDLRPAHIARAFAALGRADAVFGPASDGGFWLVGLRRRPRALELFYGVDWSVPQTLDQTLASLPEGTRIEIIDTLSDIDAADDLSRWRARERRERRTA